MKLEQHFFLLHTIVFSSNLNCLKIYINKSYEVFYILCTQITKDTQFIKPYLIYLFKRTHLNN